MDMGNASVWLGVVRIGAHVKPHFFSAILRPPSLSLVDKCNDLGTWYSASKFWVGNQAVVHVHKPTHNLS